MKLRSSVESDEAEAKAEWWACWDGGRPGTRLVSAGRSFAQIKIVELRIGDPLHMCLCAPSPIAYEQLRVRTPESLRCLCREPVRIPKTITSCSIPFLPSLWKPIGE